MNEIMYKTLAKRFRVFQLGAATGIAFLACGSDAPAAVPGAWDDFATQENANGWRVYDYSDGGSFNDPIWFDSADPDIYYFHTDARALWFYTDEVGNAGGGAFLGNYREQNIQGIRASIYIHSLDDFNQLDCAVYTNGPAGERFYYSSSIFNEDFDESGWWPVYFSLDATWWYFSDGEYIAVTPTPEMFTSVEEIGFRFYLYEGAENYYSAIDNVRLVPLVAAPEVETSVDADHYQLAFTPLPANLCWIEEYDADSPAGWVDVAGHDEITGAIPHLFTRLTAGGSGIFRVGSVADYVPITPPPPAP